MIQYRYDANGNLTNLVYPGGRNVYYAFDSLNRLTNVTDWAGRKSTITYDLDSHVTSITRPNGSYRTMTYDGAGQLTNIWEQMANSLPIAWFRLNWTNSGNMAWEFAAPLPHTNRPPTRSMTYDADNQLSSVDGNNVSVDYDGNLTSGPLTNDTIATYAFDARNRLLSVGGVTNVCDAMNNRIGQVYGTNVVVYVLNPNAKLPQVLMRIKNGVTNYYVYGAGLLYQVTETATTTNTLTYHYDYRGSTVALTDGNGNVTDRLEYSLYGLMTYRAGTSDTPFLFNGRYGVHTDPNGLLYMRARYYNPYLCRFINPDPSGFGGGLNWYCYADANPISNLDPFGLCSGGETAGSSWLPTVNGTAAVLIPGAASAQNAYTYFSQGNYANGAVAMVSSAGEAVVGGLMYAGTEATSSLGRVGNWISSLWTDGASAADAGAFANCMRQAQTLDVSTAENGAVFYSGSGNRALAEQFAIANGRTTLEMTSGGAWLDQQQLFNTAQSGLTTEQAAQVWSTLSQKLAQGASGNAVGFVNGARAGGIFNTVEYPTLLNNPNVVNVITGGH